MRKSWTERQARHRPRKRIANRQRHRPSLGQQKPIQSPGKMLRIGPDLDPDLGPDIGPKIDPDIGTELSSDLCSDLGQDIGLPKAMI
jgi:hypothetical protein